MAFELVTEMKTRLTELRLRWQDEINSHGFVVEILPLFDRDTWRGGFLPFKLMALPEKYLFGLTNSVQISGFEVSFASDSAHFRSASGRPIAELILQCYGAASLAVICNGLYHDLQSGHSFEGAAAIKQAHSEIMAYQPYIDQHARVQHPFTKWSDYS
ncbi:MAG: hypothetical protein JSS49_03340 [Planctomycetes bacterium]|nr:hypothetical protein [Planctomycetota bacterium]